MIYKNFNKLNGILETRFEGKISIEEMSSYILSLSIDKSLPLQLKILSDATNASFSKGVAPKV